VSEDYESTLDKRNFYLYLSVPDGQALASITGFHVPSEEVRRREVLEVMSKWSLLIGNGSAASVEQCSHWLMAVTKMFNDMSDEATEVTRQVMVSFAIATLIHLLDKGMVAFVDNEKELHESYKELFTKFVIGEQ
jgi:hypothetical protein